jgi:outer membrane protein assembly factor BamD
MNLYEKKEYANCSAILREIIVPLMGKNEEINARFYLAMCYFHRKQYLRAVDAYKEYFDLFPNTPKAEEALYLECESLYKESPYSNLDQSVTHEALDSLHLYIVIYPNGRYVDTVTKYTLELKNKIAKKDFDNLNVFYNLGYYNPTIICCDNFLQDHLNNGLCTEVLYIKIKSLCKLYEENKYNPLSTDLRINLIKSCIQFLNLYTDNKHREEIHNLHIKFAGILIPNGN